MPVTSVVPNIPNQPIMGTISVFGSNSISVKAKTEVIMNSMPIINIAPITLEFILSYNPIIGSTLASIAKSFKR